jgi:cbb3-type cytochrome oxidase maturation protein
MTILYLLIPLGLLLLGIAVWAFFWAVGSGQFDDLKSPAWSVVMDDDVSPDPRREGGQRPEQRRDKEQ